MGLDGIAGRALLQRLSGSRRERKRAAENDNQPPEVAPGGVARGKEPGCEGAGVPLLAARQNGGGSRDARRPVGGIE